MLDYTSMKVDAKTKAAALAAMKDYQPCCNTKKRVSIYNPWAQRIVKVAPYSAQAKKLYRFSAVGPRSEEKKL